MTSLQSASIPTCKYSSAPHKHAQPAVVRRFSRHIHRCDFATGFPIVSRTQATSHRAATAIGCVGDSRERAI
jgi:hypothetical protein